MDVDVRAMEGQAAGCRQDRGGQDSPDSQSGGEAARVLERITRIRALAGLATPPTRMLHELRELVADAETWVRVEGDDRAAAAAVRLAESVAAIEEVMLEPAGTR